MHTPFEIIDTCKQQHVITMVVFARVCACARPYLLRGEPKYTKKEDRRDVKDVKTLDPAGDMNISRKQPSSPPFGAGVPVSSP